MAFYGSLGEVNFDNLDASIADTAVDIFVYDTSKDSDGGAWRKRTQHTSWYNETLNTATRGARREFPAVAVIVYGDGFINIYDGDDPDLPMWMTFDSGSFETFVTDIPTSISMLNGVLVWACKHTNNVFAQNNLVICNFISEKTERISHAGNVYSGTDRTGIVNRNVWNNSETWVGSRPYTLVNYYINDVAMTVLPNAPIDSATQLPIPTIAVATDGGVSVIKDDGSVAIITGFSPTQKVNINEKYVTSTARAAGHDFIFKVKIPSVTSSFGSLISSGVGGGFYINSGFSSDITKPVLRNDGTTGLLYSPDNTIIMGGSLGLEIIAEETNINGYIANQSNVESPIAYISSSYNTGWMHGDIKGAFLSDTDTTNAGSELITNGTFDTDTTGWTAYNSVISVDSNRLKIDDTANAGSWSSAVQEISTEIGKTYYLTFTYTSSSDTFIVGHYAGSYASAGAGTAPTSFTDYGTTSGTYTRMIAATTTTTSIIFAVNNQGVSFVDNITFKEAVQDLSVNNKGLQVFGTITKSAVATGADLVAYSGFSSSNYLYQPYNSSLDFGTGDFCYMCWVKDDSVSNGAVIFQRGSAVNSNETVLYIQSDFRLIGRVQTTSSAVTTNVCFVEGQWNFVVFQRRGSTLEIYHNGILQGSTTNTQTTTQVGQGLSIGAWLTNNSYFPTSISLFRASSTAPSAEQIKKIYEDEKVLFQENAACTLYGSSDAVTALAYDDDNQLLHVGTSSGRSDFQGLRRINNTTTAVTTAISASNGLIVEQ